MLAIRVGPAPGPDTRDVQITLTAREAELLRVLVGSIAGPQRDGSWVLSPVDRHACLLPEVKQACSSPLFHALVAAGVP